MRCTNRPSTLLLTGGYRIPMPAMTKSETLRKSCLLVCRPKVWWPQMIRDLDDNIIYAVQWWEMHTTSQSMPPSAAAGAKEHICKSSSRNDLTHLHCVVVVRRKMIIKTTLYRWSVTQTETTTKPHPIQSIASSHHRDTTIQTYIHLIHMWNNIVHPHHNISSVIQVYDSCKTTQTTIGTVRQSLRKAEAHLNTSAPAAALHNNIIRTETPRGDRGIVVPWNDTIRRIIIIIMSRFARNLPQRNNK